jgi:NAD(P)-dependent dehydrogenase (short-subunit alcohol dehydrogenase family)
MNTLEMKTVLITGANSGIGRITAIELAKQGFEVVVVVRSKEKAEGLMNELLAVSPKQTVDYLLADLSSLKQVRTCAEAFKKRYQKLDVLINNAGVCLPERKITEDGFEEMFQVNHLSHFLLTNLLLEELKRSPSARIINVSSAGHITGTFDLNNLQSEMKFTPIGTYCNTKLLNVLFANELAERLKDNGITVNSLHPGVVRTNFAGKFKGWFAMLNNLGKLFYISPEKGAATSIYLATSDKVKGVTGKYFSNSKETKTRNKAITAENQKLLWEKSLQLAGI